MVLKEKHFHLCKGSTTKLEPCLNMFENAVVCVSLIDGKKTNTVNQIMSDRKSKLRPVHSEASYNKRALHASKKPED